MADAMKEKIAGGSSDVNPIKSDAELLGLLKRLEKIKKYKSFERWKKKFLDRLEQFLYEKGMEPADKACKQFEKLLEKFLKTAEKVLGFIEKGELCETKKTVKASLSLSEMCNMLTTVCNETETLIPALSKDEKKKGFNKFHLGAALIRQGFHQYGNMKAIEAFLQEIKVPLEHVADRQQHELFTFYNTVLGRFCDVMADLNLYEIMLKCQEFQEEPEEEESSSAEPIMVSLTVECHDGKVIKMELEAIETIGNIKEYIADGCQIEPNKQVLKWNGKPLNKNEQSLENLGIQDAATFTVEPYRVPVTVRTMDGKTIETMVDPTHYMTDLKRQFEPESGVPARNQRLYMNNQELDDNKRTADDYGIKAGSIIDLEPKTIEVTVQDPDGESYVVQLTPSDTTEQIKDEIEEVTGIDVSKQVVKHKGTILPTGKTVRELGIQNGDLLTAEILKVPITVNCYDGKTIEMMVDPTDFITDIKRHLAPESGIPANNQRLYKQGEELSDNSKRACDYNITGGTVLDLEPKTIEINIQDPDGKLHTIEIEPSDTTEQIKEKIENKTGIEVPRQVVKLNGTTELPKGKTARDIGIKDKDNLTVDIYKVPVTVNTMDGKKINIMVDPTNYISDIKRQLEPESNIPAKNQKLFKDNNELTDNNKTAGSYGIKDGTILDLEPRTININVQTPNGKVHSIEIEPNDTTEKIKEKIAGKTGMTVPQQHLTMDGKELPNGKTVKQMGIQDGDTMNVDIYRVPVTVNTYDGKQIQLMVDPTDKISNIKKQLEPESGISAKNQCLLKDGTELADGKIANDYGIQGGTVLDLEPKIMEITIQTPNGKKHSIEITPSDTTEKLKEKIASKTGLTIPQQILKDYNGNVLPNGKTVKQLGINDGDEIQVEIHRVPVTINTYDGQQIQLMVDPTNTMNDIKKQLEPKCNIPVKNQRLYMNGNELKDDNKQAGEYGIKGGTILDLEPKIMEITIDTPDGKKHIIEIEPTDTTEKLKEKIASKTGLTIPQQILKHNDNILPNNKTVKELGIHDGDNIKVEINKVPVTVNTYDGKQIQIMVDPTQKISNIKKQLEPESGISAKNQRLFHNGEELADGKTANDYGIKGGSVLDLEPKTMSITVQTPDGKTHEIDIEPSHNIETIKQAIQGKTGLTVPQQILKKDGKELSNADTAKKSGILDGDTLTVEIYKVPVTVNTYDGKQIKVMVDPTQKISTIKRQLEPESGIPADNQRLYKDGEELVDNKLAGEYGIKGGTVLDLEPKVMEITVKTPDGKTHSIAVQPSDTPESLKNIIAGKTGLTVPQQVLKHNGKELPTGKTLRDIGIKDGDGLDVDIYKVPVTVNTMDGKKLKVMVDPTQKISDIKKQLQPESGLSPSNQRLFKDGEELADNRPASDYGIKGGSVLDLEPKSMQITVKSPDGKSHNIEIKPSDTADRIKEKVSEKTGLSVPQQILKKGGKELPIGITAKEMGLQEGDVLSVDLRLVPVTVNTMDGQQIKLMVDPTNQIIDIKRQLEPESGIPVKNQRLSMDGKELSDEGRQAGKYGIKGGSVLDLEPKTIKITAETPDGNVHTLEIKPSDKLSTIKRKIEDASTLAVPRQVVNFKGKELPDDQSAKKMGLQEGSALTVDLFTIPITVKEKENGKTYNLRIEPSGSINSIKKKIQKENGLEPAKQILTLNDDELDNGRKSAEECGIQAKSKLLLDILRDHIIFIDVKCGTLFGMERAEVIEKKALTPLDGNRLDFAESTNDSEARKKIVDAMTGSPRLGVATQVVVVNTEVDDYDMQEAEKVKNLWGVNLKKRQKNVKGEEFIFVDPKTGATGELSRTKYLDMKFITPVVDAKERDTLAEREQDTQKYDKYVNQIRNVFGIKIG